MHFFYFLSCYSSTIISILYLLGGDDYDDSVVEIIFQPNDTVVCVDIPIIDDSVLEQNETFIVNLVRPIVSSGVEIGNMNKSFLTIQNDDSKHIYKPWFCNF